MATVSIGMGSAVAWAAGAPSVEQQLAELQQAVAAQKAQLEAQQKQLEQQAALIEQLRGQSQRGAKAVMSSARPTITSADGETYMAVRSTVQVDAAEYDDDDFSDGVLLRRARFGVEGRLASDFDYRFLMEFGGSVTEGPARVNDASISYRGFAPFAIQLGVFSAPTNMDDSTSSSELLFLERATPADLSRRLGGGTGRLALALRGSGSRWMSALALTSRTINETQESDVPLATVGRFGFLAATSDDYNVHIGLSGSYLFQPADGEVRFWDRAETRVDGTRLIDTGPLRAASAYAAGAELGASWKNYLLQAENYWYGVEREDLSDPSFGGYYIQASWVLTGEAHRYNMATGSFQAPRPRSPFNPAERGWGAWELASRYSHADLDSRDIRGGTQDVWTLGVNWYPNKNLRLMLDYLRVSVDARELNVVSVRSQFTF
jgi:phosphate-selective porin OprO/OprP